MPTSLAENQSWYKWVAQYNNTGTTYKGSYQMWQCTSEGRVDGIYGDVDINFWFGDYDPEKLIVNKVTVPVVKKVTPPKRATIKSIKKSKKKYLKKQRNQKQQKKLKIRKILKNQ